jgi:3-deoxy-D-manno-octulosonic-acid transferase
MASLLESLFMGLYSLLLLAVLVLGSPYWIIRMITSGRYRAGLAERLGRVPAGLRQTIAGRQVVWVHAVSVGEVLAATRLVSELQAALGSGWIIVVSTTTATGQALAKQRFGSEGNAPQVFYYPLDFAWAVRAYLRALEPKLVVLMESELWPRLLVECRPAGIPVTVVNARVSDRSFVRGLKFRSLWRHLLRRVTLFLAQSEEDARRLVCMGARQDAVRATGNLKYDIRAPKASAVAEKIREIARGRPIVVAGSTHEAQAAQQAPEERIVVKAWEGEPRQRLKAVLVLAPRHPQRFAEAEALINEFPYAKASNYSSPSSQPVEVVLLDTIGDLAAVYGIADIAYIGGSLVARGGHNPLEPAQFGVPVVMGSSCENFRDITAALLAAYGIRIVQDQEELASAFVDLLSNPEAAKAMGERGRRVYEEQQGATARTVEALTRLVRK